MLGLIILTTGILLVIVGFFFMFISNVYKVLNPEKRDEHSLNSDSSVHNSSNSGSGYGPVSEKTGVRGGGIIMLGPIPIIIGSDSKSVQTLIILAIVLMLLYFFLFM